MMVPVDPIFKALADPTRRRLLDELFRRTASGCERSSNASR